MSDNELRDTLLGSTFNQDSGKPRMKMDSLVKAFNHYDPFRSKGFHGHTGVVQSPPTTLISSQGQQITLQRSGIQ